ncbi:MAG TPA: sulfotransferase [Candidatus Binataceae bacterium]|nr:sulfotransferase [Candidatus Binataceae bacterium]
MPPRNCVILGSGRSGTSMAAGLLAQAGYFMGGELWPANEGNPKGQFEDREVNAINDSLIASSVCATARRGLRKLLLGETPPLGEFQHWVAVLKPGAPIACNPEMRRRIAALTARQPFCFKDPRFSYTLGAWRACLGKALLLCVFRDPSVTAHSIVRECAAADYMKGVAMDASRALKVWEAMYRWILEVHRPQGGDWLFVHYDQLLDHSAYPRIEERLGVRLDRDFATAELNRSRPTVAVSRRVGQIYRHLCGLAGYEARRAGNGVPNP